jgi:oligoribonuclease (3'-5' exoribonuclease)
MARRNTKFDYVLACDFETTGLALGCLDPTYNEKTGERYQAVSAGLIVASAKTLKPLESLYVEIQHDERYVWNEGAERVHGLSREYLQKNGLSRFDAATKIIKFIEKYYGPIDEIRKIVMAGHNVATFDRYFLHELCTEVGVDLQLGNRHLDTFSNGFVLWGTTDSDEVFDVMGVVREEHNALEDAELSLSTLRYMRQWFRQGAEALEAQNVNDN